MNIANYIIDKTIAADDSKLSIDSATLEWDEQSRRSEEAVSSLFNVLMV